MIERIGNKYVTANIEGGEYSYVQEAGSKSALEKAVGHPITHFKLDIRFEQGDIVHEKNIFSLSKDIEHMFENPPSEGDEDFQKISILSAALNSPFSEVERYWKYINGQASFDTHQGVKGLEFERVMVIIDDNAARSNIFSYDKLFGLQSRSDTDIKNESEGKASSLDRTRRLLYVTCSRAMDSLAIVYYTDDVEKVYSALLNNTWFNQEEIIRI